MVVLTSVAYNYKLKTAFRQGQCTLGGATSSHGVANAGAATVTTLPHASERSISRFIASCFVNTPIHKHIKRLASQQEANLTPVFFLF